METASTLISFWIGRSGRDPNVGTRMDFQALLETYGYLALFAGTFFEGGVLLLLSGYAACRGSMLLPLVLIVGGLGGFLGNLVWYELGRRYGARLLEKFPTWQPRAETAREYLDERGTWFVFTYRFIYGIRIASPIAIGMSRYPAGRFFVINAVGSIVWVTVVGLLGYLLGDAVRDLAGHSGTFDLIVMACVAIGLTCLAAFRFCRSRQAPDEGSDPPADVEIS